MATTVSTGEKRGVEMKSRVARTIGKSLGRSIFLFLIIAIAAVTGCVNIEAANRHLNYGLAYIETGQYTPALKELMEAEKNNPRDPKIHYYLGVCYHGKGLTKEAVAEFKKAVSSKPDYSEAHNYLGLLYTESGELDDAITEFRTALANLLYETPSFAMSNLGWAYYKKGDYKAAFNQYQEILNRDPNSMILPIVERNMGIVLLAQGKYGQALEHLRKSLEIAPDFATEQAHYWIGKALAGQGKLKEAQSEFEKSVKAAPNSRFAADSAAELEKMKQKPAPVTADARPSSESPGQAQKGGPEPAKPLKQEAQKITSIPEGKVKAPAEEDPKGVSAPNAVPSWHIAKRGETLYSIARVYNVTIQALCSANGRSINHRLKVGERVLIPAQGPARVKKETAGQDRFTTYHVKPGDSLTSVAKKFHTTMADIKKLNNLKADTLKMGQVLKIRTGE
ncbi:MAG: tetratricopeptide repeat protein [Syntrophaceae bacterium]